SNLAANPLGIDIVSYFKCQMKILIPMWFICMVVYTVYTYYTNKKFGKEIEGNELSATGLNWKNTAPLYYALFPALPLIFSVLFSESFFLGKMGYSIGIGGAVILSLVIAASVDIISRKSVRDALSQTQTFWQGMGKIFASVVVLIVAADIFASGLEDIGFMDSLVNIAQSLNMKQKGITAMFSLITFISTAITGSGTVSFDVYANVVMDAAAKLNMEPLSLMLPVQMITGVGRAISPIAIVIIALSEITGVSPLKIIGRNWIPVTAIVIAFLLIMLNINYNNLLI
ncbi:MAG: C4-dicarboxylate transporter DcuC, partial [Bacteroidales bacterium]|nr:C4-dicarboxylate transporter DcuC [Bacteroidales bacterium]